jgi:hypothetical protein
VTSRGVLRRRLQSVIVRFHYIFFLFLKTKVYDCMMYPFLQILDQHGRRMFSVIEGGYLLPGFKALIRGRSVQKNVPFLCLILQTCMYYVVRWYRHTTRSITGSQLCADFSVLWKFRTPARWRMNLRFTEQ